MRYQLVLPALLAIAGQSAVAQMESTVNVGERVTLRSELLDEDRALLIRVPESYHESTFRYPVLYLLDARFNFLHTVGIVEFLAGTDQIPEVIVVGVINTNRSRDLTPPSNNEDETAFWDEVGGAGRFAQFFETELFPFIEGHYRTAPYRIIRGQSFGGLFAVLDLMSATPMFNAYLTSSPAVGWNFKELVDRAPDFVDAGFTPFLYVSAAGRDFPGNLGSIQMYVAALEAGGRIDRRWHYEFFEDEGHYSLMLRSTYNGLTRLYRGWQVPDSVASLARFVDYEEHYAGLSERYGYEIRIPMGSIIRLGNRLLQQQRYSDGIAVKERLLDLYPDQPESFWHVGDAYLLSGQPEMALPYLEMAYEKAVEIEAADVERYRLSVEEIEAQLVR